MIHEEICTYEVCKLAKEKGFPQDTSRWLRNTPCRNYYTRKGELNGDCIEIVQYMIANKTKDIPDDIQTMAAPTQSLLQRWLREGKGLYVSVEAYPTLAIMGKVCFAWVIKSGSDGHFIESNDSLQTFPTYELALEDALKYALEKLVI